MPVTLGSQPDHGFDEPLGLMRDCHRRIEKFLGVLIRIVDEKQGGALDAEHREALDAALRYFSTAAPWHTRDEEDSLFPRMRKVGDSRVRAVLDNVDALESDHVHADTLHQQVDALGRRWLAHGELSSADSDHLRVLLQELLATYTRHIAEEDDVIFPLAAVVLSVGDVRAIGREMAARRGVDPKLPPARCKHARANQPDPANT